VHSLPWQSRSHVDSARSSGAGQGSRHSGVSSHSLPETKPKSIWLHALGRGGREYTRENAEAEEKSRFTLKNIFGIRWGRSATGNLLHPFWLTFDNEELEHQWKLKRCFCTASFSATRGARPLIPSPCSALSQPQFSSDLHTLYHLCGSGSGASSQFGAVSPSSCPSSFASVSLSSAKLYVACQAYCPQPGRDCHPRSRTRVGNHRPVSSLRCDSGRRRMAKIPSYHGGGVPMRLQCTDFPADELRKVHPSPSAGFQRSCNGCCKLHRPTPRSSQANALFGIPREETARFIKASPVEDAFHCITQSEALLSGQLYATEKSATLTEVLYNCIVYLTRAQIKLSLFDEHPTTDPFLFYLEGGSGTQQTDSEIARGEVGESERLVSVSSHRLGSRPGFGRRSLQLRQISNADSGPTHLSFLSEAGPGLFEYDSTRHHEAPLPASPPSGDVDQVPEPDASAEPVKHPGGEYHRRRRESGTRHVLEESRKAAYEIELCHECTLSKFASALATALEIPDPPPPVRFSFLNRFVPTRGFPRQQATRGFTGDAPELGEASGSQGQSTSSLGSIADVDGLVGLVNKLGSDWGLDLFDLSHQSSQMALMATGFGLRSRFLSQYEPLLHIRSLTWRNFLREVSERYRRNPYHNEQHGAAVAHMMVFLLRSCQVWNMYRPVQKLSIIVAALVHDVGHFGVNNNFVVNSGHPLAITYNDRSVLENFHSALAFRLMNFRSGDCNIAEALSFEERKELRRSIIELVLETDIFFHFEFVTRFRMRRQVSPFFKLLAEKPAQPVADIGNQLRSSVSSRSRTGINEDTDEDSKDLFALAKASIRGADIGHAALEWRQHYLYTKAVQTEFFNQAQWGNHYGLEGGTGGSLVVRLPWYWLHGELPTGPTAVREKGREVGTGWEFLDGKEGEDLRLEGVPLLRPRYHRRTKMPGGLHQLLMPASLRGACCCQRRQRRHEGLHSSDSHKYGSLEPHQGERTSVGQRCSVGGGTGGSSGQRLTDDGKLDKRFRLPDPVAGRPKGYGGRPQPEEYK
ncbi:3 5 -cyclic nucleotide phosphodiesterase domain-containing protein, partial [Cystoisospora suis]